MNLKDVQQKEDIISLMLDFVSMTVYGHWHLLSIEP